jgi:hypothetical protein
LESLDDPANAIVARLQQRFPTANVKVYHQAATIGANPKINNMSTLDTSVHVAICLTCQ